jgi:hypothetical protein
MTFFFPLFLWNFTFCTSKWFAGLQYDCFSIKFENVWHIQVALLVLLTKLWFVILWRLFFKTIWKLEKGKESLEDALNGKIESFADWQSLTWNIAEDANYRPRSLTTSLSIFIWIQLLKSEIINPKKMHASFTKKQKAKITNRVGFNLFVSSLFA